MSTLHETHHTHTVHFNLVTPAATSRHTSTFVTDDRPNAPVKAMDAFRDSIDSMVLPADASIDAVAVVTHTIGTLTTNAVLVNSHTFSQPIRILLPTV